MSQAMTFNKPNACHDEIQNAGFEIIAALYAGKKSINKDLNELRYLCFKKESNKKNFSLVLLPPTESAAAQHCFRTYYQVQQWLGKELDPKDWGWHMKQNGLEPIQTNDILLPDSLLKIISCKCAKDCTKSCGCVKHGLKCSEYCANCSGQTCNNAHIDLGNVEEENDIVEDLELIVEDNDDIDIQLQDEDLIPEENDENTYEKDELETSQSRKRKRME